MKMSQYYLPTLRQPPAECDTVSAKLMFRAGMIRKVASGIYEWLPLGLRVLRKVEQIVREEMDAVGGLEVSLPLLLPKEPWVETGRWNVYGKELFRLRDRKDADFCLAPTAEEIITALVRNEVRSYKQLPLLLYQFGTKFRDEIRPRFGVIRAREFLMKDAYSFHRDERDAEETYRAVFDAYRRIFQRCGLRTIAVEAATGAIGGSFSHEFMVIAGESGDPVAGEETIASCAHCGYAANTEKAACPVPEAPPAPSDIPPPQDVDTPGLRTVAEVAEYLRERPSSFIKTLVYTTDGEYPVVVALVRGDREVNEAKLREALGGATVRLADDETVVKTFGVPVGFLGPRGLAREGVALVADREVMVMPAAISGANRADVHTCNLAPGRDFAPALVADIRTIAPGDRCPRCGRGVVTFSRGIEVGHTFKLGTKYSEAMRATFQDERGTDQPFVMGCYGIGVSRVVAAAVEQCHDADGIVWPAPLAPFAVYVLPIDYRDPEIRGVADAIYTTLVHHRIEVLLDDRDERPGVKFADADLIGVPVRVTVSKKHLPGRVEIRVRSTGKVSLVRVDDALHEIAVAFHQAAGVLDDGRFGDVTRADARD